MRLLNKTTGRVIATNVRVCAHPVERLLGFIPNGIVNADDGLWFPNCSAIHTLGMRARLDVIFLDANNRVKRILYSVRANQLLVSCRGAHSVLELGSGPLEGRDILDGDTLFLDD
jgi:uncharacterized membrane protein (UPF0127 family)